MFMFCRTYLNINVSQSIANPFTGHFIKRLQVNKRINKLCHSRNSSTFTKPICETSAEVERSKVYVPFEEVLKLRRLQAKRSILVQVHSEQSCTELHEYCSVFGTVDKIIHYSLQSNMHFVLIEFKDEKSAECLFSKSSHTNNPQIIPVRSQFMWFKANDNGKRKKKLVKKENNESFIKFGSITPPSYEDLSSWLLTQDTLSEQMQLLYRATHLDDLGTRLRFITASQIENTLSGMFPFIHALPYGSSVNSFGKLNCDLDVVVNLDFHSNSATSDSRLIFQTKTSLVNSRTQQQRYIETIGELIERFLPGCCNVKRILMARVPILKFRQEFTGIECDVSLMNMTGVYMSELLYIYGSIDERVRPLIYTVRYWAQIVNLTNPTPGRWITNFSLTLLVLFYLQQIKIIPTLEQLIKLAKQEDKRFADDINCTFLRDINVLLTNPIINSSSLEELLKGFFEFYALFDFDTYAISLKSGKLLPKQEFSALYIVNPLESHLNVSKNVSPEELSRFRIEICNAARCLDRESRVEHIPEEERGLVGLFQSSHYNSNAKTVIYNTIHKKQQQTLASSNRLVTITDLFADDEETIRNENIVINKRTFHQNSDSSGQTSGKS